MKQKYTKSNAVSKGGGERERKVCTRGFSSRSGCSRPSMAQMGTSEAFDHGSFGGKSFAMYFLYGSCVSFTKFKNPLAPLLFASE